MDSLASKGETAPASGGERPLRAAFFIDDLAIGGTQRQLGYLVPALVERGFEVRVYCMRAIFDPEIVSGLKRSADVRIIGEMRLVAGIGLLLLALELRRWRADVVQTMLPTSDMIGRTLGRLVGVPAIFSSIRGRNFGKPAWQRWLDRRTARWAKAIVFNVTNPDSIAFAVQHEGVRAEQVVLIPNAVAKSIASRARADMRAEFKTAPEAKVVANIARIVPEKKGQVELLRAFALLRETHPDAVLWIVGDGEERGVLEREAERLGIAPAIRMAGARHDIADILGAIDLFVLPSRWEGMPNALMEAMAAGCPVIASEVDGNLELVRHGETGWCVPVNDVERLARAMDNALADPDAAHAVGRAAATFMQEEFSIDRMADSYARLYRYGLPQHIRSDTR